MARYAIPSDKAYGVGMKDIKALGKMLGRNHELAAALWDTGVYEARMLVSLVADPARVTPAQMDRFAKGFDNWAVCDTLCFALWVRSPHAFAKIRKWATHRDEFVKRAAFALLASLALHDKGAEQTLFEQGLVLVERAAADDRNFVKKAVSWALRAIGKRSAALTACSLISSDASMPKMRFSSCFLPAPTTGTHRSSTRDGSVSEASVAVLT